MTAESTLERYGKHRPTQFDSQGAFLPDRQDWLLAPVSRTRDSDQLTESNFAKCLEYLGGESDTVEVHRFGHWGPGWYEIILIDPSDEERVKTAEDTAASLEDYLVLDEEDFSNRESEEYYANWTSNGACSDFRREMIRQFGLLSRPHVEALIDDADSDDLLALFEACITSGDYHDGDCWPRTEYAVKHMELQDLMRFIKEQRRKTEK